MVDIHSEAPLIRQSKILQSPTLKSKSGIEFWHVTTNTSNPVLKDEAYSYRFLIFPIIFIAIL